MATPDDRMGHTEYWDDVATLARAADEARASFVPPEEPPDEERALTFLREGAGPAIAVYVDARTGEEWTRFPDVEHSLLRRAMNDYLALYARCYGHDLDPEFSLREAAEALLDTNDVAAAARTLTKVPPRDADGPGR